MKRKVALLEFSVWDNVSPLVSGLLEASARHRGRIRDEYEFKTYSYPTRIVPVETVVDIAADVYAISCYVWNTGLIMKRLLPALRARHPEARIILGGPQVMHQAGHYLSPDVDNVAVCNGEGELTFTNYLEELLAAEPNLEKVKGLSFYTGGHLVQTPDEERIANFDAHPSPYLDGCFADHRFMCGVIETNRGCPFKCSFCYWGAATNSRVRAYPLERVFGEIEWLSRNRVYLLLIADANLGLLKRDRGIVDFVAECRRKYGFPKAVTFSASKNSPPERNAGSVKTFADAGLLSALPISIQSFNPTVLKNVERGNISTEGYIELQRLMNERGNNSSVELIWPLPGETLETFKRGIATVCELGAVSFNVFPLLLINNVQMAQERDKFDLVTLPDPDPNSDAELVVATREVTHEDYLRGLRFTAHLTTLISGHGSRCVAQILREAHQIPVDSLLDEFDRFCEPLRPHPYLDYVREIASGPTFFAFGILGSLVHRISGVQIEIFDELLHAFMTQHRCWTDPRVRLAFELDLLNRPYVYKNQKLIDKRARLKIVEVVRSGTHDSLTVRIPDEHVALAARLVKAEESAEYTIDYKSDQAQQVYIAGMPDESYHSYCHGLLIRVNSILPHWRPDGRSVVDAVDNLMSREMVRS